MLLRYFIFPLNTLNICSRSMEFSRANDVVTVSNAGGLAQAERQEGLAFLQEESWGGHAGLCSKTTIRCQSTNQWHEWHLYLSVCMWEREREGDRQTDRQTERKRERRERTIPEDGWKLLRNHQWRIQKSTGKKATYLRVKTSIQFKLFFEF